MKRPPSLKPRRTSRRDVLKLLLAAPAATFAWTDAEAARFHLIASMPEAADSEWRWEDFQATNNALLADAIGNLATRVLKFIEKNAEYVGPRFADEARKMQTGEAEARSIYGEATDEEAEALKEEGIEFGRIPWPKYKHDS